MKTIKMYLNYTSFNKLGVFAVYPGEISDPVEIEIPDNWEVYENNSGDHVIVTEQGQKALDYEIKTAIAKKTTPVPYIVVYSNGKPKNIFLKAVKAK